MISSLKRLTFINIPIILVCGSITLAAEDRSPELDRILNAFLDLDSSSIHIRQEIHWRFYKRVDSLEAGMDILDDQHFRLMLPANGLEVYVLGDSLLTVNHGREQILLETAKQAELIDQLFIGGDISTVRLERSKDLGNRQRRYDFEFHDEYSEWQHLTIITAKQLPRSIELLDHDGNRYQIFLEYLPDYHPFEILSVLENRWGYELADLRKKK